MEVLLIIFMSFKIVFSNKYSSKHQKNMSIFDFLFTFLGLIF